MRSDMGSGKPDWPLKIMALSLLQCMTLSRFPNLLSTERLGKKTSSNSTRLLELGALTEIMYLIGLIQHLAQSKALHKYFLFLFLHWKKERKLALLCCKKQWPAILHVDDRREKRNSPELSGFPRSPRGNLPEGKSGSEEWFHELWNPRLWGKRHVLPKRVLPPPAPQNTCAAAGPQSADCSWERSGVPMHSAEQCRACSRYWKIERVLAGANDDLSVVCLSGKWWVRFTLTVPKKYHVKSISEEGSPSWPGERERVSHSTLYPQGTTQSVW